MNKPIHEFFAADHHRIDQLFNNATKKPDAIDMNYYNQFRAQLLRHIKMEEKVLFPAAKKESPVVMQEFLAQYRLEHGAITSLMVPPPTPSLLKVISYVLKKHNVAEETLEGLYDVCEALTKGQTQELLLELSTTAEVPIHPPNPAPIAIEAARRALQRAGYDYDEILELVQNSK